MQRKKRLKEINEDLLLDIETAVASGAESNSEIARLIGWSTSTLKNYRYGKGGNDRYLRFREPIETAIKKGTHRRRKKLLSAAEDAILELLRSDNYSERHVERQMGPADDRGVRPVLREVQKVVERRRIPNAVIAMFTAVNASQTEEKAVRWRSIHRVIGQIESDKGAILDKIDEMVK